MAKKIIGTTTVSGKLGVGTTTPTGALDVQGGTNPTGAGEPITLVAQHANTSVTALGGSVNLTAGDSSRVVSGGSFGGSVTISGGKGAWASGTNPSTSRGGNATLKGGTGGTVGSGGNATLLGGTAGSTSGHGGSAVVQGGAALEGNGGSVSLIGVNATSNLGTGNFTGGNVAVTGGYSVGTGSGGFVTISSGSANGTGNSGNITLTTPNPSSGNAGNVAVNVGCQQGAGTTSGEFVVTFEQFIPTVDWGSAKFYGKVPSGTKKGLLNLGTSTANFDGSTAGCFVGNINGTVLAANITSPFNGNFIDLQKDGLHRFVITAGGNIGVGTATPGAKIEIGGGGQGIILASPNGTRYLLTVANGGTLSIAPA